MSEYSPQATFWSLMRVSPRGVVLGFCSTFGILSEVTSRKNLRSPFAKQLTGLFCSLRSTPLIKRVSQNKKSPEGLFCFGGPEGN